MKRVFYGLATLWLLMAAAWGETVYQESFRNGNGAQLWGAKYEKQTDNDFALLLEARERGNTTSSIKIAPEKLTGKQITVSAQVRGENISQPKETWNGGKLQLNYKTADKEFWPQANIPRGSFDWQNIEFSFKSPADVKSANLVIGLQDSSGKIYFRDVKIEAEDIETAKKNDGPDNWQPLQRPAPGIVAGTAIDRSVYFPAHKVGDFGRVIINKEGTLAFEKQPGQAVRFLSTAENMEGFKGRGGMAPAQYDTKEKTVEYVKQMKLQGYNMLRTHFLDWLLSGKGKDVADFDPATLDQFDYLIYQMKENGIYLNFDAMTSWTGYLPMSPWDKNGKSVNFKFAMHFDDNVRKNWRTGVEKLLYHVNPYTKTHLADDPVLALIEGFNEQEFGFWRDGDWSLALPSWRNFLQTKYGTTDQLAQSWSAPELAKLSFDQIEMFNTKQSYERSPRGRDVCQFISQTENATALWYKQQLNELKIKAPLSNYNCGKSYRNAAARNNMDFVSANAYHAHPSNFMQKGSKIDQTSSIEKGGGIFREFAGMRLAGKPMVVTEHGHVFWNKYRYEQAFVTGAYAAFQGFDVLTMHAQPVMVAEAQSIYPFTGFYDPVLVAEEMLTFYLFRRADVAEATNFVRIVIPLADVFQLDLYNDGINHWQSRLALVTGLSTEIMVGAAPQKPLGKNEIAMAGAGGSKIETSMAGFSTVTNQTNNPSTFDKMIADLKNSNQLPKDNQTSGKKEIFESSNGQLLMKSKENFLSVNAPRLQGICGEAGATAKLAELEIVNMSVRGNLAAVAVDGMQPLKSAKRILIVYATNALNSNMKFEAPDQVTLVEIGGTPTMVRTGAFTIKIANPGKMKAWALNVAGQRVEELPLTGGNGQLTLSVDTAKLKNGPSLYFEIAEK